MPASKRDLRGVIPPPGDAYSRYPKLTALSRDGVGSHRKWTCSLYDNYGTSGVVIWSKSKVASFGTRRGHYKGAMKMKKILIQLDSDRIASSFDTITAYDAGVDQILHCAGVRLEDVRGLVYGAMFTRGVNDLKNSAVFIGGSSVAKGESMLEEAKAAFFGPVRVSLMLDANGCNTTAAGAAAKIRSTGNVTDKKIAVLAGTGPVGLRIAGLLGRDGAEAGPGGVEFRGR